MTKNWLGSKSLRLPLEISSQGEREIKNRKRKRKNTASSVARVTKGQWQRGLRLGRRGLPSVGAWFWYGGEDGGGGGGWGHGKGAAKVALQIGAYIVCYYYNW